MQAMDKGINSNRTLINQNIRLQNTFLLVYYKRVYTELLCNMKNKNIRFTELHNFKDVFDLCIIKYYNHIILGVL